MITCTSHYALKNATAVADSEIYGNKWGADTLTVNINATIASGGAIAVSVKAITEPSQTVYQTLTAKDGSTTSITAAGIYRFSLEGIYAYKVSLTTVTGTVDVTAHCVETKI